MSCNIMFLFDSLEKCDVVNVDVFWKENKTHIALATLELNFLDFKEKEN